MNEVLAALTPLDWVVAAAVTVSLYVLVDMWLTPAPAEAGE